MLNGRRTAIIICAGGIGERMGAGKPKQFIEMPDGMSILRKTVDVFRNEEVRDLADVIVVTAPAGFEEETDRLVNDGIDDGLNEGHQGSEHAHVITGGAQRQDSVRNALLTLSEIGFDQDDIVLIHDGARPFVTADIVRNVAEAALHSKAAIAAVPVKDTIRDVDSGTLDRSRLYSVQTPQGFRFGLIRDAIEQAYSDGFYGTDDGSLTERAGVMPVIVPGSYANIKITTPEDLK
jgi:2-C-methyl-D-erythritol 4-phosphate cytidylyltransferase